MKKSLSVVLSTAMALSVFSSVAFADTATTTAKKTSADFTDLKDLDAATKAKFDAMISAGIFDGTGDTTFGLKEEMNRAQFAKVAALVIGLEINKDLKTSSFSDVSVSDSATGYALPYIEALKTAGVTDGYGEGTYNPAGKVTKEQLATFLVRLLNKDADAKAKTGNDSTVSDWAQGYVALALELKLLPAGADSKFGGQANATRDLLLTGAYEVKQQYVAPGKVSVTQAKATGAKKVTVTFNKPVDTDKAKVALKKGTADVVTTTKFADDKKSAVLTLTDTKIGVGEYTVNVTGLDAASVDKTSATFTGEDEVIQKLDFVNAGDTIAYADKTIVKVKAVNQYGEAGTTNAGSYNVYTSSAEFIKITKDSEGVLLITLDTATPNTTSSLSTIPVTVVNTDNHMTITKNFKLGTQPILYKIELGAARYSVGTSLNGKGENVKYDLNLYDQYGGAVSYDTLINAKVVNNGQTGAQALFGDTNVIWNDAIDRATVETKVEDNGNDIPQLKISLIKDLDKSGDYNFTVNNQAATTTGKMTVKSAKIATKIKIGNYDNVIAAGDTDIYIPIDAYDAQGAAISKEDLASKANRERISITLSGAEGDGGVTSVKVQESGEHKGEIKIAKVGNNAKGAVNISAIIATINATSTDTRTFTIQPARTPDHFNEVTVPAKGAVPGGDSAFKFEVIDQYGKKLEKSYFTDSAGNAFTENSSGLNAYDVVVTAVTYKTVDSKSVVNSDLAYVKAPNGNLKSVNKDDGKSILDNNVEYKFDRLTNGDFNAFDEEWKFVTKKGATDERVQFVAAIHKNGTEISKVSRTLTISPKDADLNYSLNAVKDLFFTLDSGIVSEQVYGIDAEGKDKKLTVEDQKNASISKLAREVVVSATNNAGETVKLPKNITNITSDNRTIADVKLDAVNSKAFVIGNKVGTAKLNVSFRTADGYIKTATIPVTVKNDAISVSKIDAKGSAEFTPTEAAPIANAYELAEVKVTDSYGVEYEKVDAGKYSYLLGLSFGVSNPKNGKVEINPYGNIIVTERVKDDKGNYVPVTFDLTTSSTNGKSDVTAITIK